MNIINLSDLTFIIPLRIDSIDRLLNLLMVTDFLLGNFDTNIHILEADEFNNRLITANLPPKINYTFVEDFDPVFYRTHYINEMVKTCTTSYIAIWDTDVITSPTQIINSLKWLRNKEADFVYPYKNKLLDTTKPVRELFFKTRDINLLIKHQNKMKEMYPPNPVGGAFIANKESYVNSGIENTEFYGWGLEDGERFYRWRTLGYEIKRSDGPMFHLTHSRSLNSSFHSQHSGDKKKLDVSRIAGMSKDELRKEIENWKH